MEEIDQDKITSGGDYCKRGAVNTLHYTLIRHAKGHEARINKVITEAPIRKERKQLFHR